MNDFSEQLHQSARRLRGCRNAGLDVPPCPQPRRARQWRIAEIGAAACAGLFVGWLIPDVDKEAAPPLLAGVDTVTVERVVHDITPREIPGQQAEETGRLTEKTVTATGIPVSRPGKADARPVEAMPAAVRPEPVVPPSSSHPVVPPVRVEDYAHYAVASGRSVRDDSVDYSLFVSL